jgi:hypothetical protein
METDPFDKSAAARELHDYLLEQLKALGPVIEETKKTSAHIVAGKGAFLGLHPRADGLLLNIVLDARLASSRVATSEQVSRSRYHNEIKVSCKEELDEELMGWIAQAYQLKVGPAPSA